MTMPLLQPRPLGVLWLLLCVGRGMLQPEHGGGAGAGDGLDTVEGILSKAARKRIPFKDGEDTMERVFGREDRAGLQEPCAEARMRKFYVYQFESFKHCSEWTPSRIKQVLRVRPDERQRIGAGLFLEQQLLAHPWRTSDPSEAEMFVVPSYLDLAAVDLCIPTGPAATPPPSASYQLRRSGRRLSGVLNATQFVTTALHLTDLVASSPWYQRSQGRDHLLVWVHYLTGRLFAVRPNEMPILQGIRHVFRNFVVGQKHTRQTVAHNKPWTLALPDTCVLTVPHLAPSAMHRCQAKRSGTSRKNGRSSKGSSSFLHCPPRKQKEATFEEYLSRRNYTLSFAGNTNRNHHPPLRAVAVRTLADVRPPNILLSYTGSSWRVPVCRSNRHGALRPSPCKVPVRMPEEKFQQQMHHSRFSLHIKGDDPASSRVLEAWDSGTVQMFLSDRFFTDIAPFRCRVPWDRVVKRIPEREFLEDPPGSVEAAVAELYADGKAPMRRMWELQRELARDLLWHLPDSRVGHNVLEDAFRCLDTPAVPSDEM